MIPIPDHPEFSLYPEFYEERLYAIPKMNQVTTWYIPYNDFQIDLPFSSCEIIEIVVCRDGIVYVVILPSREN